MDEIHESMSREIAYEQEKHLLDFIEDNNLTAFDFYRLYLRVYSPDNCKFPFSVHLKKKNLFKGLFYLFKNLRQYFFIKKYLKMRSI